MSAEVGRRGLLAGALALAGCSGHAAEPPPAPALPPLKSAVSWPMGCAVTEAFLDDPAYAGLVTRNFSQLTAEYEMKMEAMLRPDGSLDITRADAIAAFARQNGLRLHGHTLIWHAEDGPWFRSLASDKAAFARAYDGYISGVVGHFKGRCVGWDVVNEVVAEDGDGYRDCLWRLVLGMEHVARAFHVARAADDQAVLFLNDYNLEAFPRKRATFLRLVEQLLKSGAPVTGIGAQSHLQVDLAPGAITTAMKDLASLGLPIHVSELDCSTRPLSKVDLTSRPDRLARQARLVGELREAFAALPAAQRYALTLWGLRDGDSWLTNPEKHGDRDDEPLFFNDQGEPKPLARTLIGR